MYLQAPDKPSELAHHPEQERLQGLIRPFYPSLQAGGREKVEDGNENTLDNWKPTLPTQDQHQEQRNYHRYLPAAAVEVHYQEEGNQIGVVI